MTAPIEMEAAADASITAPLAGVRVLEVGDATAAAYAGRLLVDLGADVVKVEPRCGDALRHRGPFIGGQRDLDGSVAFAFFHAGKRSVCLDLPDEADRRTFIDLALGADVVVSAPQGEVVLDDALRAEIERLNPALIVADISTFGRVGPLAGETGGDLVALAASGVLSLMSTVAAEPQDPRPLRYPGDISSIYAACSATVAILGALHARLGDGTGQELDISAQESLVSVMATALTAYTYMGVVPVHDGRRSVCPWGIYACRDGNVLVQCTEDTQWSALVHVLGDPDWGSIELFDTTAGRVEQSEAVESLVAAAIADFTMSEFLTAAHAAGVPAAELHTPRDVLRWDQLEARAFFREVELGSGRKVRMPASAVETRPAARSSCLRAPVLGEHVDDVLAAWGPRPVHKAANTVVDPCAPLAGVRVIDMTWVWAGPMATVQLAHLGADVIKIESSERIDVTRRLPPFADQAAGINRSGYFNQYNQGKRSVSLNLAVPAGREILARLIHSADVIVDNMRAGALARMGFPYERLRQLNPAIVAVSLTGFGESGPQRDRLAYGSIIDALSGVVSMTGPVGGKPTDVPMSLPDPCAGLHAAIATLAPLYRARITGEGARVDAAMIEAWLAAIPWGVLAVEAEQREPEPVGNRDDAMSPHGVFRCEGAYDWVVVVAEDDARFAALAAAIGAPELSSDDRFATLPARKANETELEGTIERWTSGKPAAAVESILRSAGVTARKVDRVDEVAESQHLNERGFFADNHHPEVGSRRLAGVPWRASRSPMRAATAAPLFGEHTHEVLRDVLGMDADEIAALGAAGVLE